jgi:hypothetical protein
MPFPYVGLVKTVRTLALFLSRRYCTEGIVQKELYLKQFIMEDA